VPTSDVVVAIEALGATATIADLVGLLTTDASTQSNILAKLTAIELDTTATVSSLSTLVSQTDDIEPRMIDGTQRTRITDGTNNVAVSNAAPSGSAYGLVVRQVGPSSVLFAGEVDSQATLAAGGKLLKSGAGSALQIQFRNTTGGSVFLQIHDSLVQPSAGARAKWYPTSATNNNADGSITFGHSVIGVPCQTGVYLVASSTRETYTAIVSNSLTYNVVYQ
jgi:hypothetical protein